MSNSASPFLLASLNQFGENINYHQFAYKEGINASTHASREKKVDTALD